MCSLRAKASRPSRSSTAMGTFTAPSLLVPPLPGATKMALTSGLCRIFQTRACSRPPEPITRMRMLYSKNFSVSLMRVIKRQNPSGFCRLGVLITATRPKIRSRLRLCRAVGDGFSCLSARRLLPTVAAQTPSRGVCHQHVTAKPIWVLPLQWLAIA